MFGYNNTNTKNVTTRIRTYYSDISSLQLSHWNENISIRINPLKEITPEGIRTYDYTRKASTALTADKSLALSKEIEEKILPKIKEYKETGIFNGPVNAGVSVGNKGSAIFISYEKDDKDIPYVFITIYMNIDPEKNIAPADSKFSYKFAKVTVIENYNPETGEGTEVQIDGEFLFFYEKIKNIVDTFGSIPHSINNENAYKAEVSTRSNNKNFSNNNGQQNYNAPVNNFNDNEFPFEMG